MPRACCNPLEALKSDTGYLFSAFPLLQGQYHYWLQTLSCPGDCCFQAFIAPQPFPYEMLFLQSICMTNESNKLIKGI